MNLVKLHDRERNTFPAQHSNASLSAVVHN